MYTTSKTAYYKCMLNGKFIKDDKFYIVILFPLQIESLLLLQWL